MACYSGKIAVVTGGGSGIGAEVARALQRAGALVIVADIDEAAAQAVVGRMAPWPSHRAVGLDVRDGDAVEALFDDIARREGRVDFVFNNAGVAVAGEFHHLSRQQIDRVLDVDLRGCAYVAHAAMRMMVRQRGGHLVNTASGYGLIPGGANAPYIASKWGVVGLSESLRIEGHDHGVRVSVVCPGFVRTAIVERLTAVNFDAGKVLENLPVKMIEAPEAARLILEGVARNQAIIAFPRYVTWLGIIYRLFPKLAFRYGVRLMRRLRQLRG